MKNFIVACIFVSFLASNAFGVNWKLMASGQSGAIKFYLDTDSIKAGDNVRKFWTKVVYGKEQVRHENGSVLRYSYTLAYQEVECYEDITRIDEFGWTTTHTFCFSITKRDDLSFATREISYSEE